ncbi:undecaprenyl-diphosphate phosphatase [Pseudothermotoga thermarum]|uniref:undecaprenyl-diphosphate phosphatase n=1 Tax=Pseudothermotoga thermarum TaxID=119394 RepID=UPI0012FDB892|nr:undecaprenyl-diphosphate phosphatase [Pseudothermotoga thermarum]
MALVQGATEFLPVSSSGHIVLLGNLFKVETDVSLTVLLHLGTLLAILIFAAKHILRVLKKPRLIFLVILSTLPAALIGIAFDEIIEKTFQKLEYLPVFFCITALLLALASAKNGSKTMEEMKALDSLIIGIFQAAAIFPGVSRSGATIAAAILLGFDKKDSLGYSFLLAIPAITGAGLLKAETFKIADLYLLLLSFVSGLVALFVLRKIVLANKLKVFSVYCLVVALMSYLLR